MSAHSFSPQDVNRWNTARRVLCVRLDSIGDVLMTTPALRAVRTLASVEHITLLTSAGGAEAGRLVPEVDQVWTGEVAWLKHTPMRASPAYDLELIRRIQDAQFDAAIIFTVLTQNPLPSAMMCYLAGVPLRLAHCRENPYQLLTDWVIDTESMATARHEVTRQLDLVQTIGATTSDDRLSLRISDAVRESMRGWLETRGLAESRRWCVLHPGATAPSRRYPREQYAQVARSLIQQGFQLVVSGDWDEAELVSAVTKDCTQAIPLVGQFDVEQLAALIDAAPILLTNNTGPAHIAAAVGTPVVDLYALTNSQHKPWRVPQRVLSYEVSCRNCLKSVCPHGHNDCLTRIEPESVVDAVLELWQECEGGEKFPNASAGSAVVSAEVV